MKRIYKTVAVATADAGAGFTVLLDSRPVGSPGQRPIILPGRVLADAIAAEWDGQGETIDVYSMPMMGFAATVIDRVAPQRGYVVDEIAGFGGSDRLCYLAEEPIELTARQEAVWAPLRDW